MAGLKCRVDLSTPVECCSTFGEDRRSKTDPPSGGQGRSGVEREEGYLPRRSGESRVTCLVMPRIDQAAAVGPLTILGRLLLATWLGTCVFLLRCPQARSAGLIVYGTNWAFAVGEPHGWVGDTQSAKLSHANIIFHRQGESAPDVAAGIRVVVATKVDEDTTEDLAYDMNEYRKRYPAVQSGTGHARRRRCPTRDATATPLFAPVAQPGRAAVFQTAGRGTEARPVLHPQGRRLNRLSQR